MGRGRAKAKQTKVARELKYNPQHTDLDALQRELSRDGGTSQRTVDATDRDPYDLDADDDEAEADRQAWH